MLMLLLSGCLRRLAYVKCHLTQNQPGENAFFGSGSQSWQCCCCLGLVHAWRHRRLGFSIADLPFGEEVHGARHVSLDLRTPNVLDVPSTQPLASAATKID